MALSESQILTVAKIVQVDVNQIDYQICLLADDASATWQTAVEAEITRWTTASTNFVAIEPKEKNFGARIDPNSEKNDIRANLAILFQRPDWKYSGGGITRTQRG